MTHPRNTRSRAAALVAGAILVALVAAVPAGAATFSNTTPITIDNPSEFGPGNPYPSEIAVAGVSGVVTDVDVTLRDAQSGGFDQYDVLLVSPTGRRIALLSDICGDELDITIHFSHGAPAAPAAGGCPDGNTYAPTDHPGGFMDEDVWPSGLAPDGSSLGDLVDEDPNGTWQLYVRDDGESSDDPQIAGGWSIDVDTRDPAPVAFNLGALTVPEGGTAVVDVVRTGDPLFAGSVTVATTSGTATAGSDFTPVSQRLDFAPGETTKRVEVPVLADGPGEAAQDFSIVLGNPEGDVAVGTPGAVGITIPADPGGAFDDVPTGDESKPPASPFTRGNTFRNLPGARRCRRTGETIRFRPRMPNGVAVVRSEVFVNGRKIEDNVDLAAVAPIILTMRGRRMRVLIRLTSHDDRVLRVRRTFRRCRK